MKVTYLQIYAILFTFFNLIAAHTIHAFPAQQQTSSITEDKVVANTQSPSAPGFTPGQANDQSQDRVIMRMSAPIRRSAGSSGLVHASSTGTYLASEWFRNPVVFAGILLHDQQRQTSVWNG